MCTAGAQSQPAVESAPASAPGRESLARFVPADTGLFVEARDAGDWLAPLTAPLIWSGLADLAGQPSRPEDVEAWRSHIRQTVGMEPDEAIRTLLSRRVAFIAPQLGQAQDAAVLCLPLRGVPVESWIRLWRGRPLGDDAAPGLYRLGSGIGLFTSDEFLAFGDAQTPGSALRTLSALRDHPAPTLYEASDYQALAAFAPHNPDALLFARPDGHLPAGRVARAAALLPRTWREAKALLLTLRRDGAHLRLSAFAQRRPTTQPAAGAVASAPAMMSNLPTATLAAWEGRLTRADVDGWMAPLPADSVWRVGFDIMGRSGVLDQLTATLEGSVCVAIGEAGTTSTQPAVPPPPAIAVLLRVRDADAALRAFGEAIEDNLSVYQLIAVPQGLPSLGPIERRAGEFKLHSLEISGALDRALASTLGRVQLCWAVDRDVLLISSHVDWAQAILQVRRGSDRPVASAPLALAALESPEWTNAALLNTAAVGRLARRWLNYLELAAPHLLTESWWRSWPRQPEGRGPRLGIDVREQPERQRLQVVSVLAGGPADGVIQPGDVITGSNQRAFATTQPASELRSALQERPHGHYLELNLERDGRVLVRRVPLPMIDGAATLRRLVAIGELVSSATYVERDESDVLRGELTIKLVAPQSQPASSSAGAPVP